jgi:hypothetical protein
MTPEIITLEQWLSYKPYNEQVESDLYYINVSNILKEGMYKDKFFMDEFNLDDEATTALAIVLASYIEDKASNTNIYNTFKRTFQKMYQKSTIFKMDYNSYDSLFDTNDVMFLVWYYISMRDTEVITGPNEVTMSEPSFELARLMAQHAENPPCNEALKFYYQIPNENANIFDIRSLINNLLFHSYLFYPDTQKFFEPIKNAVLSENYDELSKEDRDSTIMARIYESHYTILYHYCTRLLALNGKEWCVNYIGEDHPLSEHILNISQGIRSYYMYRDQSADDWIFEHIASGMLFEVSKESYAPQFKLIPGETILYTTLNRWKDKWYCNGIYMYVEFDADMILDLKFSQDAKDEIAFLNKENNNKIEMIYQEADKLFNTYNNNSPIAFIPAEKLFDFIDNFNTYYNDNKTISQTANRNIRIGVNIDPEEMQKLSLRYPYVMIFSNPKHGFEFSLEISRAIPDARNPGYKEDNTHLYIWELLIEKNISPELARYCFDNYAEQMSFFKTGVGKDFATELDFIMRFYKQEAYYQPQ